jgi:multidrug efflux pump subunit AcrA (membrane-fusion protein)
MLGLVIVIAVLAALVLDVPFLRSASLPFLNDPPTADAAYTAPVGDGELNFAEVVMTDLTQEEEYNGKLESIEGEGEIIPAGQIDLAFDTAGTVVDVPAQVGQEVQAGDVLGRLDVTVLAAQDEIAVAQAQLNVADEITQLEANVAAAEAAYGAAREQVAAADTNIEVNDISVAQAERQLADAQAAYQQAWDPGRDWELYVYGDALENEREAAAAALQYAQENLQIAQANYDAAVAGSGISGLLNAQGQLLSAREALSTALSGLEGYAGGEVPTVITPTTQAQLNLRQAQLTQETHRAGANLVAPFDGVVTSVDVVVGQAVDGGTSAVSLVDLAQPTLEVLLDETNLDQVAVGTEVEARFSALPAEQFSGTIVQIDPQLSPSNAELSLLRALVRVDNPQGYPLPAGLSASVNVRGTSNRIIRTFLPIADEGMLAVGDPVSVELPDFSLVPGTVVFVPQTPSTSASGSASFEVLIEIDDAGPMDEATAATLDALPDETSVDVIFVSDAVTDVMAVPVSALVALLEGGYAVEKRVAPNQMQLVAVDVGFFGSDNRIAVTSDSLQPEDQVVVP